MLKQDCISVNLVLVYTSRDTKVENIDHCLHVQSSYACVELKMVLYMFTLSSIQVRAQLCLWLLAFSFFICFLLFPLLSASSSLILFPFTLTSVPSPSSSATSLTNSSFSASLYFSSSMMSLSLTRM